MPPLISCIMPTANRRRFVPQSIHCFLAQTYAEKELIIVDDGADPIRDLLPDDARIRYFRPEQIQPLGAKRNFACRQAQGELIVHWDDDDWSAPWRLKYQGAEAAAAQADICGLDRVLFYAPAEGRAWEYAHPPGGRRWVYGASLSYTKAFWQKHPFPAVKVGEDTRFVWADARARIRVLEDPRFLVALVHRGNTSPKCTRHARYRPKAPAEVESLLGDSLPFYRGLETQTVGEPAPMQTPLHTLSRPPAIPKANAAGKDCMLITASRGIGDILRVTPLIRVARQLGYEVDVLVEADYPEVVDLLIGAPEIRHVFRQPSPRRGRAGSAPSCLPRQLYDVATFTHWSGWLRARVRAKRTYRFDRSRWLQEGDSRSVERLARRLGWKGSLPEPFAMVSDRPFQLPAGTVAIHPGCKYEWPWKKWHGFAELARRLAKVVIVGSAEDLRTDNTYFDHAFEWPAHARDFTGKLSLAETAALLKQCAALIANDSGVMHLGVALGVPTFGIFGITSPRREGLRAPHFFPISKGLPCEPTCRRGAWGRRDCHRHLECLKALTVEEIMEHVLNTLPSLDVRESSRQLPNLETKTQPLSIAASIGGGVGDVLMAGGFLNELFFSLRPCVIDVCYHNVDVANFAFHGAGFIRRVLSPSARADGRGIHDLSVSIGCGLVRFEARQIHRLEPLHPGLSKHLAEASRRFERYRGLHDSHPQLDGLWGRICVLNGRDRRTSMGYLGNVPLDGDAAPFLAPDQEQYDFFERTAGRLGRPYLTIHDGFDNNARLPPGSATKCWPLRHWTGLVEGLRQALPEVALVQLGSRNSRSVPGVDLDLVHKTTLHQAAWVLKHALVHIDSDSGLVHLARAVHTPCVVLFGPTDVNFFGYPKNTNLSSTACANCWWSAPSWLSRCPRGLTEPECMAAIDPQLVSAHAVRLVQARPKAAFELVAAELYDDTYLRRYAGILTDLFERLDMRPVPISEHAKRPDCGLYVHASKQWEYLFVWHHLTNLLGPKLRDQRIADLGGGRGALAAYLALRGAEVDLFDLDFLWDHGGDLAVQDRFLHWAEKNGYRARFSSLFNVRAEAATYEAVLSVSVLEHLHQKHYALQEALRLVKPGGLFVLTFDFTEQPERHADGLRREVFCPASLDAALKGLSITPPHFTPALVRASARAIQHDKVLGIPFGMTVGGVVIRRRS